jgi:acyl-CoA reductase-like NAD-dependent aldehyde dehydrogenase
MLATFIGVLGGLAGVGIGAILGSKSTEHQWRNDQRLAGFVGYTATSSARYDRLLRAPEADLPLSELVEWRNRDQNGRATIHLLAGHKTREATEELAKLVSATTPNSPPEHHEAVIAALNTYTAMARKELGSKD